MPINSVSIYPQKLFNVVLIEPEIPNNTGNIGRTCVGLWSTLHLVGPLGFSIDDKQLKRAGLDYWDKLDVAFYKDRQQWMQKLDSDQRIYLIETTGEKTIYDIQFQPGDHLVFGQETKGLPKDILDKYSKSIYKIPFPGKIRSFNLANCVAMVMGEGLRQLRSRSLLDSLRI